MSEEKTIELLANELLSKMGVKYTLIVKAENEAYLIDIKSDEDAPLLIGHHGEMISSLKRVMEAILFKKMDRNIDLIVNVNDYIEKQKERLFAIAESAIRKLRESGENQKLQSLSSYERKLIHEYIKDQSSDLTSRSEGEGIERSLIVSIKSE